MESNLAQVMDIEHIVYYVTFDGKGDERVELLRELHEGIRQW